MKTDRKKTGRGTGDRMSPPLAVALVISLLVTSAATMATPLDYYSWRFTGTTNNRPFTVKLRTDLMLVGSNGVFGTPLVTQPTNGYARISLLPGPYMMSIDQVSGSWPFDVPDSTNAYNLFGLINHSIYVLSPTQTVNGITIPGDNIAVATANGTNTVSLALTNAAKFAGSAINWWGSWTLGDSKFWLTNTTDGGGFSVTSDGVLSATAEMDAPNFVGNGFNGSLFTASIGTTPAASIDLHLGANQDYYFLKRSGYLRLTNNIGSEYWDFNNGLSGGNPGSVNPLWSLNTASGTAGVLSCDGSGVTNLNATKLATGTLPNSVFPATLPAASGANLTNLNANVQITNTAIDLGSATNHAVLSALSNAPLAVDLSFSTNGIPPDWVKERCPVPPLLITTFLEGGGQRDPVITNSLFYITNYMQVSKTNGMWAAGWTNVFLEDGQYATNRDGNGDLQPSIFHPDGFNWLTTFAHTNGFNIMSYLNVADGAACLDAESNGRNGGNPGTHWDQLLRDLRKNYDWGFDGMLTDSCGDTAGNNANRLRRIGRAFNEIFFEGKNIFTGMGTTTNRGGWLMVTANTGAGYTLPWEALQSVNMVGVNFDANDTVDHIHECMNANKYGFVRPGHFLIPTSFSESTLQHYREELCAYAMVCGPVQTSWSRASLQGTYLLANRGWIDILQDPAVIPAVATVSNANTEVWVRPLGSAISKTNAVMLVNKTASPVTFHVANSNLLNVAGETLALHNPLVPQTYSNFTGLFDFPVAANDGVMLKIWPAGGGPLLATKAFRTGIVAQTMGPTRSASGWFGIQIQAVTDLYLTHLGRWIQAGNDQSHRLLLVDGSGTCLTLASTVVDAHNAQTNTYVYAPLLGGPVKLTAGSFYYMFSSEVAGGDLFYDYSSAVTGSGDVTVFRSAAAGCNQEQSGSFDEGPVNFLYTTTNDTSYSVLQNLNISGYVKTATGLLVKSNTLASIPTLSAGDTYYWSSNGVAYVICSNPSGVLTTNKLGP